MSKIKLPSSDVIYKVLLQRSSDIKSGRAHLGDETCPECSTNKFCSRAPNRKRKIKR